MALHSTEELIEELRDGRMIILMDDEDRENEGDLVIAAQHVTAENINFMARYGRGLICLTMTQEECGRLNLPLMTQRHDSRHKATNFTVSIEAAQGVTTGISAADRAHTIQTAVADDSKPGDLVQPGHVFPLMAQPGGVLSRAGHTEAGCDLCRLAGLKPASTIVEILNEDGSMARRPDLEKFAAKHHLKIGTIADLIHFRIRNEKTVHRIQERALRTEWGDCVLSVYRDDIGGHLHFALVKGEINGEKPVWVRVQLQNSLTDLLGADSSRLVWTIGSVCQRLAEQEQGVVVYLCEQWQADELLMQLDVWSEGEKANAASGSGDTRDLRTIGLGAQILADLGVRRMRVLGRPKRIHALSGFGLEVLEYVE